MYKKSPERSQVNKQHLSASRHEKKQYFIAEELSRTSQQCNFAIDGPHGHHLYFCPPANLNFLPSLTLAEVSERQRSFLQTKCVVSGRMRLILIREPVITFLLLSLMLTTASPPICLSFSMTIPLCLAAQSLSHCQSACVSLGPSHAHQLHACLSA